MTERPVQRIHSRLGLTKRTVIAGLVIGLAACATRTEGDPGEVSEGVGAAITKTESGLGDAILSPIGDLNLTRTEIPPVLKRIERIYTFGAVPTCAQIKNEVRALNEVLGPDDDMPDDDEGSDAERVGEGAADATLNAVSGTTSGLIPFRGLVRQATGASAHERRLRAAYSTGLQRRAYLKGLGQAQACPPPASPQIHEAETPEIVYRR